MKRILSIILLIIVLTSVLCVPAFAAGELFIIQQPVDQTANTGNVKFTVKAAGEGLTYQWQWYSISSQAWVDSGASGYATDTLIMPASSTYHGREFRCIVTDQYGNSVTSWTAKLYFGTPEPSDQPSDTPSIWSKIGDKLGQFFGNLAIPYEVSRVFDIFVGIWLVIPIVIRAVIILGFTALCFIAVLRMLF